jgi:hypothetical protein
VLARSAGRWLNGTVAKSERTENDTILGYAFTSLAMLVLILGQAVDGDLDRVSVILIVVAAVILAASVFSIARILVRRRRRSRPRGDGTEGQKPKRVVTPGE